MSTCQHQYESDARSVLMDNRDKPRCTIRTCNGPRSQHRLRRSSDLIRKRYQRGRSCRHRRLPWRHLLTKLRHPEIFLTANNGQTMQLEPSLHARPLRPSHAHQDSPAITDPACSVAPSRPTAYLTAMAANKSGTNPASELPQAEPPA